MTRALVTGGCGFAGRHFVKGLVARDFHVTIVDDLSTGLELEAWPRHLRVGDERRMTFVRADVRDWVKAAESDFDLVIHLAAVVGGRMMIEGDPLKVATDLSIDATFFNWLVKQRRRPRKVVYASSSAVYPVGDQRPVGHRPLREELVDFGDQIGLPDFTYGWSKLTGELLSRHAARSYDLDVVVYRPFSGYGEDQDLTYPFPSIIDRVARRESPIVVWGSGDQLRDFIHMDDCVEAVFATMDRLAPGEALNLGSGQGTSFRQLAALACRIAGHSAEIVNDATKPEGVFARVGDCERMFRHYRPAISLESGIERALEFISIGKGARTV